ncbi:hypothetical protein MMPV_002474 [Pyropia vietnamensis]
MTAIPPRLTGIAIATDGTRLAYSLHLPAVFPPAGTVVYIAGLATPASMWAAFPPALPQYAHLVYDNRGVAASGSPSSTLPLSTPPAGGDGVRGGSGGGDGSGGGIGGRGGREVGDGHPSPRSRHPSSSRRVRPYRSAAFGASVMATDAWTVVDAAAAAAVAATSAASTADGALLLSPPYLIVGHSMGGMVALTAAAARPAATAGVVAIACHSGRRRDKVPGGRLVAGSIGVARGGVRGGGSMLRLHFTDRYLDQAVRVRLRPRCEGGRRGDAVKTEKREDERGRGRDGGSSRRLSWASFGTAATIESNDDGGGGDGGAERTGRTRNIGGEDGGRRRSHPHSHPRLSFYRGGAGSGSSWGWRVLPRRQVLLRRYVTAPGGDGGPAAKMAPAATAGGEGGELDAAAAAAALLEGAGPSLGGSGGGGGGGGGTGNTSASSHDPRDGDSRNGGDGGGCESDRADGSPAVGDGRDGFGGDGEPPPPPTARPIRHRHWPPHHRPYLPALPVGPLHPPLPPRHDSGRVPRRGHPAVVDYGSGAYPPRTARHRAGRPLLCDGKWGRRAASGGSDGGGGV